MRLRDDGDAMVLFSESPERDGDVIFFQDVDHPRPLRRESHGIGIGF